MIKMHWRLGQCSLCQVSNSCGYRYRYNLVSEAKAATQIQVYAHNRLSKHIFISCSLQDPAVLHAVSS